MAASASDNGGQAGEELAQLADQLLEEIQAVRDQWRELDDVLARIEAGGSADAPARPAGTPVEARDEDPVQLMAREMMRAGRSREDTRAYLSQTFGIEVDDAFLDTVFEETSG